MGRRPPQVVAVAARGTVPGEGVTRGDGAGKDIRRDPPWRRTCSRQLWDGRNSGRSLPSIPLGVVYRDAADAPRVSLISPCHSWPGCSFPVMPQSFNSTPEKNFKTDCIFVKSEIKYRQVALLITASRDKEAVAIKVVIAPTICCSTLPALAAALA